MFNKEAILDILEEEGLNDIEVIKEEEGLVMVRFFYDFDDEELAAADDFVKMGDGMEFINDDGEESQVGPREAYLSDIAIDYVGELLEDMKDEEDIEIQYIGYDLDEEMADAYEFVGLFFDKSKNADIDEILDEMEI